MKLKIDCAYDKLVPINEIIPNPKNPNKHPLGQIKLLAKIIEYQGMRSPIVVSTRSGFITKGHGRLDSLKLLGWPEAPVDYQDYENEAQEYADMVADNKIAEFSTVDMEQVKYDIKSLDMVDIDFKLLAMPRLELYEDDFLEDKEDKEEGGGKIVTPDQAFMLEITAEVMRRSKYVGNRYLGFEEGMARYLVLEYLKAQSQEDIIKMVEDCKDKQLF
jgi:hypothetical protein